MATITELEVGISPVLREEYSALVREMDEINRELKMADQCLALLNKMESIGKLPTDKAELKIKAIRTKLTYGQKVPVIKARIMELEDLLKGVYTGKINIKGTVYPGVKIVIGTSVLYVKEQEQHVTFTRDHGDLVRTSYLG